MDERAEPVRRGCVIAITPGGLSIALVSVVAVLTGAQIVILATTEIVDLFVNPRFLVHLFNLEMEQNVPTWYSSAALLLCALLATMISRTCPPGRRGNRWYWAGLGAMLAFLSLDELAQIHELFARPVANAMGLESVDWHTWAWVVPYVVLGAAFAAAYVPFLLRLPSRTRNLLVLGGAVFVAGAAGLELVGALLYGPDSLPTFAYLVVSSIEEVAEMAAVVIVAYALAAHLRDHVGPVLLSFGETRHRPAAEPPPQPREPEPSAPEHTGTGRPGGGFVADVA